MVIKESKSSNKDHNALIASPIPKPSVQSGRFANMHLKLNLEKNVYESYRMNIIKM